MSLPFPLDTEMSILARSYLRVAAKRPGTKFGTGDPLGKIDAAALIFLRGHDAITFELGEFCITPKGVHMNEAFNEQGT